MTEQDTPTFAYALSLLAGILILGSGIMFLVVGAAFMDGMMGWYYHGMMSGYPGVTGFVSSMMVFFGIGGIICGLIVLIGSFMLNTRPESHGTWGVIILVVSFVSLFESGGYFIGALLGIIGGILAITWKPSIASGEAKKSG